VIVGFKRHGHFLCVNRLGDGGIHCIVVHGIIVTEIKSLHHQNIPVQQHGQDNW
jgi:hypothetical protein